MDRRYDQVFSWTTPSPLCFLDGDTRYFNVHCYLLNTRKLYVELFTGSKEVVLLERLEPCIEDSW